MATNRELLPKCQVSSGEKADEFVEKVPKTKLDKLPEVAISYRLQVFAREKNTVTSLCAREEHTLITPTPDPTTHPQTDLTCGTTKGGEPWAQ